MKFAVVYSSKTGNTKKLAKTVPEVLKGRDLAYLGAPDDAALCADCLIIGFWTDKGTCDKDTEEFLKKLKNKKVFLFGTAGFGMSPSYFQTILESVKKKLHVSVEVMGSFMCAGQMPQAVRTRYEAMEEGPRRSMLLEAFDAATGHPNETDTVLLAKKLTETDWK